MTDEQFKILCAKVDNIANVIVIEGWLVVVLWFAWLVCNLVSVTH